MRHGDSPGESEAESRNPDKRRPNEPGQGCDRQQEPQCRSGVGRLRGGRGIRRQAAPTKGFLDARPSRPQLLLSDTVAINLDVEAVLQSDSSTG